MAFTQLIEVDGADEQALHELVAAWDSNQAGVAPGYLGARILADNDRPGRHLLEVDFSSEEEQLARVQPRMHPGDRHPEHLGHPRRRDALAVDEGNCDPGKWWQPVEQDTGLPVTRRTQGRGRGRHDSGISRFSQLPVDKVAPILRWPVCQTGEEVPSLYDQGADGPQ